MAAGNHLEKGIWALFVIAAPKIKKAIKLSKGEAQRLQINQLFELTDQAITKRRSASPIRLVNAVIIPAPKDFEVW